MKLTYFFEELRVNIGLTISRLLEKWQDVWILYLKIHVCKLCILIKFVNKSTITWNQLAISGHCMKCVHFWPHVANSLGHILCLNWQPVSEIIAAAFQLNLQFTSAVAALISDFLDRIFLPQIVKSYADKQRGISTAVFYLQYEEYFICITQRSSALYHPGIIQFQKKPLLLGVISFWISP